MKLLLASLLCFTLPCLAQTQNDHLSENFSLTQAAIPLTLEQNEFDTIYRTDQVDSTCYRSEVQGTTNQCHTEYDQVCHNENQNVCENVPHESCQSVPRNECSDQSVCENVNDSVCNSHGCTSVPRRECHTETSCHSVPDNVCHTDYSNECHTETRQACDNVPRQACANVPNVVQIPYSCQKPVQTPIGQKLKLHTKVYLTYNYANLTEAGPLAEVFSATLSAGKVRTALVAPSQKNLFQVVKESRTEQAVSATEKTVNYALTLKAVPIAQLNAFQSLQITDPELFSDHIEFGLSGGITVPFKGHLTLTKKRFLRSGQVMLDQDFTADALSSAGNTTRLDFKKIQAITLEDKHHDVVLDLVLDLTNLAKNTVNPEAIKLIQNGGKAIESKFGSNPQF